MTQHLNLFGEAATPPNPPRHRRSGLHRLAQMHAMYGYGEVGKTCATCVHLARFSRGGYLKCAKFGATASEATDWRAGWQACGLYEESQP